MVRLSQFMQFSFVLYVLFGLACSNLIRHKKNNSLIKKRSATSKLFELAEGSLIDSLEKIQSAMGKKQLNCMPRSIFYNGSCIYISGKHEKLSWKHAERFCRKLPLNTSLLVIQNEHKMEFIRREIVKLSKLENPSDQLEFYVGFSNSRGIWKWVNNQSLQSVNLTLGRYWWDWGGSHGDCGNLALVKGNELILRSAPCFTTSHRFMCEYSLNPCYTNNICGPNGKCVNLYYKFYCDCSNSMFYTGKFCDKINFQGIQAIIGVGIIVFLVLIIFCNSEIFNKVWNRKFEKKKKSERTEKKDTTPNETQVDVKSKPDVIFNDDNKKSYINSLTKKFKDKTDYLFNLIKYIGLSYFILFALTFILVAIQVVFAHKIFSLDILEKPKNLTIVRKFCMISEQYYMFEDLSYLPFSLLFLLLLYFNLKSRRFNRYIMVKFRKYFESPTFKAIQTENRIKVQEKKEKKETKLREQKYGRCRLCMFKFFRQKFCSCFCCLCCCSCFVPPGAETRCFVWYCCCLGWKQTDIYKVLRTVRKIISNVLLCFVWKALWRKTRKIRKDNLAKKKENKNKKKKQDKIAKIPNENENGNENENDTENDDETTTDLDQDESFEEDDYDIDTQSFIKGQCPFPSTPFSTSNRGQSAAVYVIYTYDVLNIFMSLFTTSVTPLYIPYFGYLNIATSGVIVNLIIQFLQVLIIGIKFYPILVVADAEPNTFIYFLSTIYIFFIWIIRFFKRSFCSRSEAFITQMVRQFGDQIGGQIKSTLNLRYNISNTVLGLFSDDPNPNEKYISAIKEKVPSIFKEFFGRYNPSSEANSAADLLLAEDIITTPSSYYLYSNMPSTNLFTTTTTSYGLRDAIKDKTISKIKSTKSYFIQREQIFATTVSVLENLPLYLTLSYLLVQYGLLFFGSIISRIRDKFLEKKAKKNSSQINNSINEVEDGSSMAPSEMSNDVEQNKHKEHNSRKHLKSLFLGRKHSESNNQQIDNLDEILASLNKGYVEHDQITDQTSYKKNHNYCYIQNLLGEFSFVENSVEEEMTRDMKTSFKVRVQNSFWWNLFEEKVYKKVPYMKYSKQFVNTYIVAFMTIYFFTLFGFRLSNIFGNALVGSIELIYRFVFRGLIPKIDTDSHNFNTEFRTASLLTSLISFYHLYKSIKKFHEDLIKLHKGEKFFSSLVMKYRDQDYKKQLEKRKAANSSIALDSLHFPGYLVAHLVYGYVILFLMIFLIIMIVKVIFYIDGFWGRFITMFLPLFILFAFKFLIIQSLVSRVLYSDSQRITNLALYYVVCYFNFFFDCFLGLVACISRIWQTTIISMLYLPRLDTSLFNANNDLLMRRMDKGHLAYLNYVRMEHWYNNQILKGFCEMLIESMFYSQIYRAKYQEQASISATLTVNTKGNKTKLKTKRLVSNIGGSKIYSVTERVYKHSVSFNPAINRIIKSTPKSSSEYPIIDEDNNENSVDLADILLENRPKEIETIIAKTPTTTFKYSSFLRLRNLIFLCLFLKKNPSLKRYRFHYLLEVQKEEERLRNAKKNQTFNEFYTEKLGKKLSKLKKKLHNPFGKSSVSSKLSNQDEYMNDLENEDNPNIRIGNSEQPSFTLTHRRSLSS